MPRIDRIAQRCVSTSCDAAWGNIRYGKGFRTQPAVEAISRVRELSQFSCCLDVGASRGSFIGRFRAISPRAEIWALEPDREAAGEYANRSDIRYLSCRLEQAELPSERFDLVYCSHTLEHLASPRQALQRIHHSMRLGGLVCVDVPRLDLIGREDLVEEFFIDKHLYHFSEPVLVSYVVSSGFRIHEKCSTGDAANIMLVAEKATDPPAQAANQPAEVERALRLLNKYQQTQRNRVAMFRQVARRIEALADCRLVIWGAGRIFDGLVRCGGLDTRRLAGVVDRYLPAYVENVHGLRLRRPEELPALEPEVVIVASREYAEEIRQEAAALLLPTCRIVSFQQLAASVGPS